MTDHAPLTDRAAPECEHPAKAAMQRAGVTRPFYCYVCGERVSPA